VILVLALLLMLACPRWLRSSVPFVENPRFCALNPGEGNFCRIQPFPA